MPKNIYRFAFFYKPHIEDIQAGILAYVECCVAGAVMKMA